MAKSKKEINQETQFIQDNQVPSAKTELPGELEQLDKSTELIDNILDIQDSNPSESNLSETNPSDLNPSESNQINLNPSESNQIPSAKTELPGLSEQPAGPTIHDTYRKFINQAKEGYISGLDAFDTMVILRHCEKVTKRPIGINVNCPSCIIDLIKLFAALENK